LLVLLRLCDAKLLFNANMHHSNRNHDTTLLLLLLLLLLLQLQGYINYDKWELYAQRGAERLELALAALINTGNAEICPTAGVINAVLTHAFHALPMPGVIISSAIRRSCFSVSLHE
jgi:hypothetical protein